MVKSKMAEKMAEKMADRVFESLGKIGKMNISYYRSFQKVGRP